NKKALESFQKITEIAPKLAVGYRSMGVMYYRQNQWQQAIDSFEKALAVQPHAATYSNLGTAYAALHQWTKAADMYQKSLAMSPDDQIVVGNLADCYRWMGDFSKSNEQFELAIKLAAKGLQVNPRDASSMGYMALYE